MHKAQPPNQPSPQLRSFVLRVYQDEEGALHGQIDNPGDSSRTPFSCATELLERLTALLAERSDSYWSDPCQ